MSRTSRCRSSGCAEFLDWFRRGPHRPIWLCPLRLRDDAAWPLYPLRAGAAPTSTSASGRRVPAAPSRGRDEPARSSEKVRELDGHKSLYSDAVLRPREFDELYGGDDLPGREGGATTPTTDCLDLYARRCNDDDDDERLTDSAERPSLASPGVVVGGELPLRFTAYDGSAAGPRDAASAWTW